MNTCYSETELERLALGFAAADDQLWGHLVICDRCRDIYKALVEQRVTEDIVDSEAPVADDESVSSTVIRLRHSSEGSADSQTYRLAAGKAPSEEKYVVQTFMNEERGMIGRVMQEKSNHEVTLFLLSEDAEQARNQRVILTGSGLEAVTDEEGCAHFGPQKDFHCSGIEIHAPLAVFDLMPMQGESIAATQIHTFLLKNHQLDEIDIEIENQPPLQRYRISLKNIAAAAGKTELKVMALTDCDRTLSPMATSSGVQIFEVEMPEKILKIHIF